MSAPNADASLNKTTRITERATVQFRAEVFNVSNKFNFYQSQPNSTLTSSAFGRSTRPTSAAATATSRASFSCR